MKKILQVFIDIIDLINTVIARIVSYMFVPLAGLAVFEVVKRRVFGRPTIWSLEMIRFSFVPIAILALGYTLLVDGHATIDVISEKFKDKTKAIISIICIIIFLFPTNIIMLIDSYKAASMSWATLERTPSAFNAPIYPVRTLIPIGFALLALATISWLLKNIYFLATNERIESKTVLKLTKPEVEDV